MPPLFSPAPLVAPASDLSAQAARQAGRTELAQTLIECRQRTLALFSAFEAALAPVGLAVPVAPELNPPLWELGHVAWFQDWWIARNRQRGLGLACAPEHLRAPPRLAAADALYNSSRVAHADRWSLPLPNPQATREYLSAVLADTLALLATSDTDRADDDTALYFYRLVLFHEHMHAEALVGMAQALGLSVPLAVAYPNWPTWRPNAGPALQLPAADWPLGWVGAGFYFDNEAASHPVAVPAFAIDRHAVTWAQYLPFIQAGGYAQPQWWCAQGWQWLRQSGLQAPRYLRPAGGTWQAQRLGAWQTLNPAVPAVHLSHFEAQAWCRFAGRCLPTEAQWEYAALTQPDFHWGQVWEWTASPFMPYPGFSAHPYRDYSAPWFGSRPVLRGASAATAPAMAHPRYRNYFTAERNDVLAGFRSCALA